MRPKPSWQASTTPPPQWRKETVFCTTNGQKKLSFIWKWTKSKNIFLFIQKKIMRNNPFFYQTLFQSFPWPCYYNCHFHCFTVISYLIKVRAWQKAPKEIVGLPVLHFAGGLMDYFQKKTSTFFTLCVHFRSSPEYMLIATVDKQTRKLNI